MVCGEILIGIFCLIQISFAEIPEQLQDLQTEFFLPYSVTEDVDFSITRPGGYGCYQWSVSEEGQEVVALDPHHSDYELLCGTRLEFRILKNNGHPNVDFKLIAENVDPETELSTEIPQKVEYNIRVRPVHQLEVLGLKTELVAGSDPTPFGVAGYDSEENEFDTLDGLQLTWYIGGKREVAVFENHRQLGPIIKVVPIGVGKGACIAVLTDPNYENVKPAHLEFTVKADLFIEPDGAFLLEGGKAHLKLFEKSGLRDSTGEQIKRELVTTGEDPDFKFEVKEPEYVTLDGNNVTAQKIGETTIFVKNPEGEIVKGMPIRVTKAHSLTVKAHPNPESKQLILDHDYTVKVTVFNKEGREIYPSENILTKITFPKQFHLRYVSDNGLLAEATMTSIGLGKVKASLRSVLTDDDEEIEIVPHVKGSLDFEVYEQVTIEPKETILPWDDNVKPVYTLTYKAKGGGQVYAYSVDNEEAATANSEGHVETLATGPVSLKVKAYMPQSEANFDEAEVYILAPTHVQMLSNSVEFSTRGYWRGQIAFYTLLPDNDKVMFSDCSYVPYEVTLSDPENFVVDERSNLGQVSSYTHCAYFNVKAKTNSGSTKITVSYLEPSSGRTLRAHTTITVFSPLEVVHPVKDKQEAKPSLLLPIGSSSKLVLTGGPRPWHGMPTAHFKQIEIADNKVAKVTHQGETNHEDGAYKEEHVYDVTCLKEGETEVTFLIGNSRTKTQEDTVVEQKPIIVKCAMPSKLTFKYEAADESKLSHHPKFNRVLANKNKALKLTYTLKDKTGATFHNTDSLNIEAKVSDDSIIEPEATFAKFPEIEVSKLVKLPGKPIHILKAKGKDGPVDLKVKLAGYNQAVLDFHGIKDAPALPKVIDDDEDMDYEDEEEFMDHGHSLLDELELQLTSQEEMNKVV